MEPLDERLSSRTLLTLADALEKYGLYFDSARYRFCYQWTTEFEATLEVSRDCFRCAQQARHLALGLLTVHGEKKTQMMASFLERLNGLSRERSHWGYAERAAWRYHPARRALDAVVEPFSRFLGTDSTMNTASLLMATEIPATGFIRDCFIDRPLQPTFLQKILNNLGLWKNHTLPDGYSLQKIQLLLDLSQAQGKDSVYFSLGTMILAGRWLNSMVQMPSFKQLDLVLRNHYLRYATLFNQFQHAMVVAKGAREITYFAIPLKADILEEPKIAMQVLQQFSQLLIQAQAAEATALQTPQASVAWPAAPKPKVAIPQPEMAAVSAPAATMTPGSNRPKPMR